MLIRIAAVLALLTPMLILPANIASACTCAIGDALRDLERSDAAFVGRASSRSEPHDDPTSRFSFVTYTFEVEAAVKGEFGDQVEVLSASQGSACGFEGRVTDGERTGVFLTQRPDGQFLGGLCDTIDADLLIDLVSPLPPPDGTGPLALLVGGNFGDARLMALDADGNTLAYGFGQAPTGAIAVCPASGRSVELHGELEDLFLTVRDLRTFEVLHEVRVFEFTEGLPISEYATLRFSGVDMRAVDSLACLDENAEVVAFAAKQQGDHGSNLIVRMKTGPEPATDILWRTPVVAAAVSGPAGAAFVLDQEGLTADHQPTDYVVRKIDLEIGQITDVASFPKRTTEFPRAMAVSPDGRHLAMLVMNSARSTATRLMLANLSSETATLTETQVREATPGSKLIWTRDDSLIVITNGGDTGQIRFDLSLNEVERSVRPRDLSNGVWQDDGLYGLTFKSYRAAALSRIDDDTAEQIDLRTFDRQAVLTLVGLPEAILLELPPDAPSSIEQPPVDPESSSPVEANPTASDEPPNGGGISPAIISLIAVAGIAALAIAALFYRSRISRLRRSSLQ